MANRTPLKAKFNGSDTTALSEFESGDTLDSALLDTGTGANQLVQLDSSAKLPAVDGSQLTGIDGLPTQSGNSGKYLTTNGSAASWGTVASGGVNMTSATTAPSNPSVGDQWYDTANGVLYVQVTDGTDAAWLDISSANGTAAASAGGGGGAWEVVSSQTVTSAVSSVDFTGMSGYDEYRLVLNGVYISSNGGYLKFWPRQGGSFQTGGADAQRMTYNARSGSASETFWGTSSFMITSSMSSNSGSTTHGELRIPSPHTTKNHLWSIEGIAAYGGFNFYRTTAHFNSGAASDYKRPIDGVQIIPNSGTIDGGTFTLYGIKNS